MATFRKRGNRWQVLVRRKGVKPLAKTFGLKADAQRWATAIEQKLNHGALPVDFHEHQRTTLGELLHRYQTEVTVLKKGRNSEQYRISRMRRHCLAEAMVPECTPARIAAYRDERLRQVSSGTVRRELAILQHCFEVARKEWNIYISENPVMIVRKPAPAKGRCGRISPEEWGQLRLALSTLKKPILSDVIEVAVLTAMRRSEILAVCWKDLDSLRSVLSIQDSKNGERRTVPLSTAALAALVRQPRGPELQRIFLVSANAVRLAWERLKRRAGIVDLRFHDLRHEAVSTFFEMGLSIPEVQLLSGHKDHRMLLAYTHLRPEAVAIKLQSTGTGSPLSREPREPDS
jgi:integrase